MSWELVYALPDKVILNEEKCTIEVGDSSFNVRAFQKFWKVLKDAQPPESFLVHLNDLLKGGEVAQHFANVDKLPETLSATMNGVRLDVGIDKSLISVLSKVFETSQQHNAAGAKPGCGGITDDDTTQPVTGNISVSLQIPNFSESPTDELEEKFIQLFIEYGIPALRWQGEESRRNFSAKLAGQLPNIEDLSEAVFNETVTSTQVLVALAIVLKCYPEKWRCEFFWDAWLAVTLQLCSLPEDDKVIFPCLWVKQIFEVERNLQDPNNVKLLLFGLDPVSKVSNYGLQRLCKATGIAFHAVGNDNPSIEGMKEHYGLDCDDDNPLAYCQPNNGLLLVNLIRCIGEEDSSLSNNTCRRAWVAYTLKVISKSSRNKWVIVLSTSSSALTRLYIPTVCEGHYVQVPHPSARDPSYEKYADRVEEVRKYLKEMNLVHNQQEE